MEKLVVIMRGLSGSGKSTYLKQHYPEAVVCSADEYFSNLGNGQPKYDPNLIGEAHQYCFGKFLQALAEN